jgi:hypothetical protein
LTTPVPKLARGWIVGLYLPSFGLLLWATWTRTPPVFAVLVTVFVLLVNLGIIQALSTNLRAEGLSQLTLQGWVRLRWTDIQHVTLDSRGSVILKTADGIAVRISPIFFYDFDATLTWLAAHLTHAWPQNVR